MVNNLLQIYQSKFFASGCCVCCNVGCAATSSVLRKEGQNWWVQVRWWGERSTPTGGQEEQGLGVVQICFLRSHCAKEVHRFSLGYLVPATYEYRNSKGKGVRDCKSERDALAFSTSDLVRLMK
mmetsp:Transcript_21168/g.33587  ORF Transcript_21168/g.33587 Transcript_21168/m.33587 type:complete len:124 (+) Transcript_21168:67-438(+)